MKRFLRVWIPVPLLLVLACGKSEYEVRREWVHRHVNLSHLDHLYQEIGPEDKPMGIVHIYAEYPDYAWHPAPGEGIACVDDAARAAVVYLNYFRATADGEALRKARALLDFVLSMQDADGEFTNFIFANGERNTSGATSRKSFGWWAVRAYWALSEGMAVFENRDSVYAALLAERFLRARRPLAGLMESYGETTEKAGFRVPAWLVNGYAADASAVLIRALCTFLALRPRPEIDAEMAAFADRLARGILKMQLGKETEYPGLFLSWPGLWHAWGNGQCAALAGLSRIRPGGEEYAGAALREASHFLTDLTDRQFLNAIDFTQGGEVSVFPQIAYGIRPAVEGLLACAPMVPDPALARNAGRAAAWLCGRNRAGKPMYDSETGRCMDGLTGPGSLNRNSGAESTIEALLTLLAVSGNPEARREYEAWRSGHP